MRIKRAVIMLLSVGVASAVAAQQAMPSWEEIGRSDQLQGLFMTTASSQKQWEVPIDPAHIIGPVYFVGTKGLGCFLIKTPKGHILLNTGMPGSGPMIAESIRKLGLKPEDVRILLTNHGHVDHVGGHAWFVEHARAKVYATEPDVEIMQTGGAADYFYGNVAAGRYAPFWVNEVIGNGDKIELGDVELTALVTPGHDKSSTTFVMTVRDGGQRLTVVFPDGTGVNPGYRLLNDPNYRGIAEDYERSFATLAALHPDIWLTGHTEYFDFEAKLARAAEKGTAAWIDPAGYQAFLSAQRAVFDQRVAVERGETSS
jgi:metallo-beta-lactamase class B